MTKSEKKQKMKRIAILAVIIIIILIFACVFMTVLHKEKQNDSFNISAQALQNKETYITLGDGVNIVNLGAYAGNYVEDGTDEFVENVMMLVVENTGSKYIQLARITVNNQYIFEFTTLLPGESMIVLEKSRALYDEDLMIQSTTIDSVALFNEMPTMHEELLEVTGNDYEIIVTNVSDKVFQQGKVFYKNTIDDVLLGGITYSGSIPTLQPGESVKLSAGHFIKDSSRLMFVTYAE